MRHANWCAGALVAAAIGLIAVCKGSEHSAQEIVDRLGGTYDIEPRFGLDALGVIVQAELTECKPTAADLAELKNLRHLRVLDLSRTPIGDRELLQLVDASCPCIVVPDGQTSAAVRAMFCEDQIVIGLSGYGQVNVGAPASTAAADRLAGIGQLRLIAASVAAIWAIESQYEPSQLFTSAAASLDPRRGGIDARATALRRRMSPGLSVSGG
jgi:hypothetical protein